MHERDFPKLANVEVILSLRDFIDCIIEANIAFKAVFCSSVISLEALLESTLFEEDEETERITAEE